MRIGKLLCFVIIIIAGCVLPARASTISLNVLQPVQVGSTFEVQVLLNDVFAGRAGDLVTAFGFNVTSGDNSILQYLYADVNPLFEDVSGFSGSPMVAAFNFPGVDAGTVGLSDTLVLATLHFMAVGSSPTSLGVTAVFEAANAPSEGVFYTNDIVNINTSTLVTAAVAEPGSLILLISAIPAVLLLSGRNRTL